MNRQTLGLTVVKFKAVRNGDLVNVTIVIVVPIRNVNGVEVTYASVLGVHGQVVHVSAECCVALEDSFVGSRIVHLRGNWDKLGGARIRKGKVKKSNNVRFLCLRIITERERIMLYIDSGSIANRSRRKRVVISRASPLDGFPSLVNNFAKTSAAATGVVVSATGPKHRLLFAWNVLDSNTNTVTEANQIHVTKDVALHVELRDDVVAVEHLRPSHHSTGVNALFLKIHSERLHTRLVVVAKAIKASELLSIIEIELER